MTATYATYQGNVNLAGYNASRVVRYLKHGKYNVLAIFDPPSSFTGERPVFLSVPGGANQKKNDLSLGANATAQMMTDTFGAYVVIVGSRQGGIDVEGAEEADMVFSPDLQKEILIAIMFLRAHREDTAVVGSTRTIAYDPRYWCLMGDSAGAWKSLWGQLVPRGDFGDLADALAATGDGRFKYDHDHTVGFMYAYESQNRISDFCEYVVDGGLAPDGETTYLTNTPASTTAVDATAIVVDGDTADLYRANRITVTTSSSYTTSATQNSSGNTFAITGSSQAIPRRARIVVNVGGTDYSAVVKTDYAGGAGSVSVISTTWTGTVSVPSGTAVKIAQEFAVASDFAGGSGTVSVWPSVQFPIADNSPVSLTRDASKESYLDQSWAIGYVGTKSDGRVWRSDDASGLGIPLSEKRHADVDYLIHEGNPRLRELNLLIVSPADTSLNDVDRLTGERSFWLRLSHDDAEIAPERITLHDEADMASLAHQWYLATGNGTNVQAYLGDLQTNVSGTASDVPWLKGRNSAYSTSVLEAWLTDEDSVGGSFA